MIKRKLTRKELVEQIRQKMPSNYNEMEKLAFIEAEVAKHVSFDEKYLWGDKETKQKIYELAKKEARKPTKEVKRKLICVTIAELFGYVAENFGFEVFYQKRIPGTSTKTGDNKIFGNISKERQEHVCPVIGLSNGQFIELDIQHDLAMIQTRSMVKRFGLDIHMEKLNDGRTICTLDEETVSKIFRKIYGLSENELFTDDYIKDLANSLRRQGKTPIEMIEEFMNDPRIIEELKNTRCIEANKIYKLILNACYVKKENEDRAWIDECILLDNKGQKRYSFCISAERDGQKIFYVYSKSSRKMVKLTQMELQQMIEKGMHIGLKSKCLQNGNEKMLSVNEQQSSVISSKEGCLASLIKDIFWDESDMELE